MKNVNMIQRFNKKDHYFWFGDNFFLRRGQIFLFLKSWGGRAALPPPPDFDTYAHTPIRTARDL